MGIGLFSADEILLKVRKQYAGIYNETLLRVKHIKQTGFEDIDAIQWCSISRIFVKVMPLVYGVT